jgi:choline dehydrogenase-like flavoprotein
VQSEKYDVVVIGGGAAGCVVASYIAEHTDASIALIEAGDVDGDPFIHIPAGFSKILQQDRHVWKENTIPQHGTVQAYRSAMVLGGGSSINAMCYVRGQPRDYERWQEAVGDTGQWSFGDLLAHFRAQEDNDTFHDEYHGVGGGLAVQLPKGINELNRYCLKAFQEYGLPYNSDYNGMHQRGVSPVQSTIRNHRRCSTVDAYLRPHLESRRVTLLTNRIVTRVLIENRKAIGVEFVHGGVKERVLAAQVIVSAGATHSPKILMHSGVGPEAQLRQHGIDVKLDSPEVGENLQDHPMIPVRAYVKGKLGYQATAQGLGPIKAGVRYLMTKDGPASGSGIETVSHWDPTDLTAEPTIQCYHVPVIGEGLSASGPRSGVTFELAVLQPRSRGWVRLADGNPASMPVIHPNFVSDPWDIKTAVGAVKAVREVMAQESLIDILEEEVTPGSRNQSDEQLGEWVKQVASTMWHPVGTCRMGKDDRAVVDARLRVNGVDNLRVIDASIMPNIVSGNTNAPTQALARHGAAMFVGDFN